MDTRYPHAVARHLPGCLALFAVALHCVAADDSYTEEQVYGSRPRTDREGEKKQVAVTIPVLGSYSKTWPLNCPKSKKIIDAAAEYYSTAYTTGGREDKGVAGGLVCLFLLATGDARHLPVVKSYFESFIRNPEAIGDHTWNNGYNGIAACEYYLRTGDNDIMPVIQFYCDNARDRQKFDCGWPHWGRGVNPGYCGAGIMNPASSQILTTLLLRGQNAPP